MEDESSSPPCGPFTQSTNPQTDDILLNFNKLSINEIEINLQNLEKVVQGMKDKSHQTIPLLELLAQLGVQDHHPPHTTTTPPPPPFSSFSSPTTPKMSVHGTPSSPDQPHTPPKTASSISSSVNSSWSAASFQASPIQFNFQTPQKIFVFEAKASPKVEERDSATEPPPDTVPPTIDPPGKGISKSLFFDSNNEGGEESKASVGAAEPSQPAFVPNGNTAAPSFSFGAPPSNKKSTKLRGSKKTEGASAGGKPKSLFQTQSGSGSSNPFTFGTSVFPPQSQPPTDQFKQENAPETADDDDMEIGQTDETNPPQPKLWSVPTDRKLFGETQPSDTNSNRNGNSSEASQQIPKKKSGSAVKRRLRSQKKGSGKEDLSKLDNIFANISLQPNFQSDADSPQAQEPKPSFIFFPPPPASPTNGTSAQGDQQSSTQETSEIPRPQRETSSSDSRKIQMAEIFKREGKDMYSLQRYDLAYHAFTKCLQTAPPHWQDRPNVLSNRAAALIMMERLVEAVADCDEAAALDPQFVKVQTRKGRALLKLGQINEASDSFCYVLSWQPKEPETNKDEGDRFGKDLARQAMKQVVLAKTLRERLLSGSCGNNKQVLQTAEELLSLCPYMRWAQTCKAQALCEMRKWSEAKAFMELCVCSIHQTMQSLHAHPAADFISLNSSQSLQWCEVGYSALQVDVDAVVAAILTMGSEMAKWYAMSLKNQDICRTSCSAESMLRYHDIISQCKQCILTAAASAAGEGSGDWGWVMEAEKQIRLMIALKNEADEKFRNNLFMEAIQAYSEVLVVDEHAHLWNAIMFGNRAASSMRLGLFHEAVSDCHQSVARDEFYSRAYLRRARAHRALGNHTGSIRDYRKYLKFDPKPADWQTVEEELLEVLRSKNDEERSQRTAPPGWAGSGSSSHNSNRTNKQFNFDRSDSASSSFRPGKPSSTSSDWYSTGDSENSHSSPNRDKKKTSAAHHNPKMPSHDPRPKATVAADVTSANFYIRLGVSPQATEQEIKTAYRKLALKYHPDKNCAENAAEIFKSVTEAYTQISDKSTRRSYDESLSYQRRSTRGGRR